MLDPRILAGILVLCLTLYFVIHLIYDIQMLRSRNHEVTTIIEPPRPSGGPVTIAFLASGMFWLLFFISPVLLFFNRYERIFAPFSIQWSFVLFFQILGVILTVSGVLLAIFGRIARGSMPRLGDYPKHINLQQTGRIGLYATLFTSPIC